MKCVRLKWLHTSDVHGSLFAYDYLSKRYTHTGLSSFYTYVQRMRSQWGERLIVTDGGDCLQGQPTTYYYNYIDTQSAHLVGQMMNEMGYTAGLLGNHDVETGHAVYDRWRHELNFPLLGANVTDVRTGEPYLQPYTMVEREGVRIAILGLITPAIPNWLPEVLWKGLRFDDMLSSARHWMQVIQEREAPDLVVGMFHSGLEGGITTDAYTENSTLQVVREVPGFDLVLYGHDHRMAIHQVDGAEGRKVLCVNPSSLCVRCAEVDIRLTFDEQNKVVEKRLSASLPMMNYADAPETHLLELQFEEERKNLEGWMNHRVATLHTTLQERDAYFGPSLFIDLIQQMQMEQTGADISFAAPVSFDACVRAGELCYRDMFSLYKYENFLYTMRLSGREVKGFLEMSYALWTNRMASASDHCLLIDYVLDNGTRKGLKNVAYNMEAAAGICYTVDVTKPEGERVCISSMANGKPFSLEKEYLVAMNSYRGNGGGELLTRGAGIAHEDLPSRIVSETEKDLRYYLMEYLRRNGDVRPQIVSRWKFIPEEWTKPALQRDRSLLFADALTAYSECF